MIILGRAARRARKAWAEFRVPWLLRGVAGRGRPKRALLSYLVRAFDGSKGVPAHTNVLEARAWAETLADLGYCVDVVDFDATFDIDFAPYDVIAGFGEPMERTWQRYGPGGKTRIAYATGCHPHFNSRAGLARLVAYHAAGGAWAPACARLPDRAWPAQFALPELLVVLGDRTTEETFLPWRVHGRTERLPAFYLDPPDPAPLPPGDRTGLLWFGSAGCIHKGLDIAIAALRHLPGVRLHVCGANPNELAIARIDRTFADVWDRVLLHGHLTVGSAALNAVFAACRVVVHPSASEGGSPAVLTAVANGGLVPVVCVTAGLDVPAPAAVAPATPEGVAEAARPLLAMPAGEFEAAAAGLRATVRTGYSHAAYRARLKAVLARQIGE